MASGPRRHPKQWSYLHRRDLTVSHAFALDALRWMRRWLRGAQVCLAEAMGLDGSTQRIVTGLTFFSRRRIPCLCLAGASVGAGCGVRAASHLAAGSFLQAPQWSCPRESQFRPTRLSPPPIDGLVDAHTPLSFARGRQNLVSEHVGTTHYVGLDSHRKVGKRGFC
jgi:hypothetical protein